MVSGINSFTIFFHEERIMDSRIDLTEQRLFRYDDPGEKPVHGIALADVEDLNDIDLYFDFLSFKDDFKYPRKANVEYKNYDRNYRYFGYLKRRIRDLGKKIETEEELRNLDIENFWENNLKEFLDNFIEQEPIMISVGENSHVFLDFFLFEPSSTGNDRFYVCDNLGLECDDCTNKSFCSNNYKFKCKKYNSNNTTYTYTVSNMNNTSTSFYYYGINDSIVTDSSYNLTTTTNSSSFYIRTNVSSKYRDVRDEFFEFFEYNDYEIKKPEKDASTWLMLFNHDYDNPIRNSNIKYFDDILDLELDDDLRAIGHINHSSAMDQIGSELVTNRFSYTMNGATITQRNRIQITYMDL